ncbi:MAG: hypothetical protein RIR52_174 [Acidobacteriota bacterium]
MVKWVVKWVVNVVTVVTVLNVANVANVAKWMKAGYAERSQSASTSDRLAIIGPLVLAVFSILATPVVRSEAKTQPVSRSFQITPGGGEVEVINQIGTIRVISTDSKPDRVSVRAKRLSGGSNISTLQSPTGKVVVEVSGRGTVEIEIVVPATVRLDLLTYKGDIAVSNHQGQIRARIVSDGDIFFTGLRSSNVEGRCHYGNIYFRGEPVTQGGYLLRSFSGQLDVRFPTSADFKLAVSTHQGGLDLGDFPLRYDHRLRGIVEAVAGVGRSNVYLQTQEGNIRLQRLL